MTEAQHRWRFRTRRWLLNADSDDPAGGLAARPVGRIYHGTDTSFDNQATRLASDCTHYIGRMRPPAPPTAARDAATAALRELILAGERYRIAVASHLDLTVNESRAISHLLARGPMGQTDLATALGLTTSSTTTLVDRLVQREMVLRVPHPDDRRRSTVEIPESAMRRLSDVRDWMPQAFDPVAAADLPGVATLLDTLAAGLRGVTSDIEAARTPSPGRRKRH